MTKKQLKVPLWVFFGTLAMQLAWLIALPPFSGNDEIDHIYRAASVAEGNWGASNAPGDGWGALLPVRPDLVEAARPICETLKYYGPDNCNPVATVRGGNVLVASAATRYNPIFYWVIGTPARLIDGVGALYAMRVTAALACAGFISLAAWAVSRWSRTVWPVATLLVCLTPMVVHSNAVAAPNGVEMCAALAVWACLLGLTRADLHARTEHALIVGVIPAATVEATVRHLGPFWLLLTALVICGLIGLPRLVELVRRHSRTVAVVTSLTLLAAAANTVWVLSTRALSLGDGAIVDPGEKEPLILLAQPPLWIFQSIGVFPGRLDLAPHGVYAAELTVLAVLMFVAARHAHLRLRLAIFSVAVLSVAIPAAVTVGLVEYFGVAWQGRYTLPFAFGMVLMLGLALDEAQRSHRFSRASLVAGWLAISVAQVAAMVNVQVKELADSPLAGDRRWILPWPWLTVLLMLLGLGLWAATIRRASHRGQARIDAAVPGSRASVQAIPGKLRMPQLGNAPMLTSIHGRGLPKHLTRAATTPAGRRPPSR
jgi:hypothetical protein